jgi:hypothetical protein
MSGAHSTDDGQLHPPPPKRASTMSAQRLRVTSYWLLVSVAMLTALSAIGGGVGMIVADGLSMPKSLLADTPFTTFAIPGLIVPVVALLGAAPWLPGSVR